MRTTLGVTLIVFISKAIGFIRDIIQTAYFGRTAANDAYTYAYSIFYLPILLFSSCITSTLVPLYVEARDKYSLKRANAFASNVINVFAAFALVISVVMYLLAGPLVRVVAPGLEEGTHTLAVQLTRIMLPSLVFVVISLVMSTILNAQEQYIAAQLTGFPLSVSLIIATVCFSGQYGIQAVAWGVFVAGILQMLIQAPPLFRSYRHSFRLRLRDKRLRRMLLLAVPSVLSMAVNEINHLIDYNLASGLPDGSATTLRVAFSLITFVTGVLIVPLTTVMFSRMSVVIVEEGKKGIIGIVKQSLETLAMALLPVIAVSMIFCQDIIRIAYQRGNFTAADTQITAGVFACYAAGILSFGYRDFLNRAFHAMQDTRTPMINACISVVINVVASVILRHYFGVYGLALGTSIAGVTSVGILLFLLKRRIGKMGMKRTAVELIKIVIASLWAALAALTLQLLIPSATTMLGAVGRFAGCAVVTLGIYTGILILLRVRQLDFFRGLLRR